MADNNQNDNNEGMTVQEAGRKGGEATAESHGREFYQEIGKKGGETVSQDREHMAEIGKKGGEHSHGGHSGGEGGNDGGSGGSRGGSHEQHVKAGEQSHKNS